MKYYIVSIGAIFISLGIGILVGYNLNYDQELSKQQASVISDLDKKFDSLKVTNDNLEKSLADLSDDYDEAITFINDNINSLVGERLTDKNIGIISTNQENDYTQEIDDIITTSNGKVGRGNDEFIITAVFLVFHGVSSFFLHRTGKAGRRPPVDSRQGQGKQDPLPRVAQAQHPHQVPLYRRDQRLRNQGEKDRLVGLPQAQNIQHLAGGGPPPQKAQVELQPHPGADLGGSIPLGAVGDGHQQLQLGKLFHSVPPIPRPG